MIPLADGFGGVEWFAGFGVVGWLVEGIKPAAADMVGGGLIIFELEFGTGGPNGRAVVGDVEHDAAVAGFGDVVIELEFEPVELAGGDDVAGIVRVGADEGSIFDQPARPDAVTLEVVPTGKVLAVKEQLPALGLF